MAVDSYNIVILKGGGGNGKSTLLGNLATEWAEQSFVAGKQAQHIERNWPIECISRWRNQPPGTYTDRTVEQALNRLIAASQQVNTPTKVLFVLDALDEMGGRETEVDNFIATFQELIQLDSYRSWISLIVTCRDPEDFGCLRRLSKNKINCNVLSVEQFSKEDIANRIEYNSPLSLQVTEALREMLRTPPTLSQNSFDLPNRGNNYEYATLSSSPPVSSLDTNYSEILGALLHPIVWRFFTSKLDEQQQLGILADKQQDWNKLGELVVEWFQNKCQERIQHKDPNERYLSRNILIEIAKLCPNIKKPYPWEAWNTSQETTRIYRQAVSSGLVKGKLNGYCSWEWSHSFLPQYLANLGGEN